MSRIMRAPDNWPFGNSSVVPGNLMPTGRAYNPDDSTGEFLVFPLDVPILIGYGFAIADGNNSFPFTDVDLNDY